MRKYFGKVKNVITIVLAMAMSVVMIPIWSTEVLANEIKKAYEIVVEPTLVYETVYGFFCDKSPVMDANGKWGIIDSKGREIIPCEYDVVEIIDENTQYVEKRAEIEEDWVWGYVNNENKMIEYKRENVSNSAEDNRKYTIEYSVNEVNDETWIMKDLNDEIITIFDEFKNTIYSEEYICVCTGLSDINDVEFQNYEVWTYKGERFSFSTCEDVVSTQKGYLMFFSLEEINEDEYINVLNVYNSAFELVARKEYSERISWMSYYPNFDYVKVVFYDWSSEIYSEEGQLIVGNEYDSISYVRQYDKKVPWLSREYGWLRYSGWETEECGFFARDKDTQIYYWINMNGEREKEYGKFEGGVSIYYWNDKYYFIEIKEIQITDDNYSRAYVIYDQNMKIINEVKAGYEWSDLFLDKYIYRIGLLQIEESEYYIDSYFGGKLIDNISDAGIYNENLLPVKVNGKWGVYRIEEYSESVEEINENSSNSTTHNNINTSKGNNSSLTAVTKKVIAPAKAKLKKVVKGKKKVSLTIKKVKGAKGYLIQYAANKKFKKAKKKFTTKTKITIKKLKSKKKYYFRVKAYKLNGKKKVLSKKWSNVKSVNVK